MTASPSDPQSAGNASDPVAADQSPFALTFEDKLHLFWKKHSALLIVACIAIAVTIIGVGVYDYVEAGREADITKAYAAAGTPESLKAFADANSEHVLGATAYVRLADDAFAAGKTAEAQANYEKAAKVLKEGPLSARIKLGLAMTKVLGGKAVEGTADLKQLVDDANQFKGVRAEAAYHLASLAAEGNNGAEVQKYSDLLMQIDPASPWTQRAISLRASFPATSLSVDAAPSGPPAAPAIQLTPMKK